jgi:hypothetical protein
MCLLLGVLGHMRYDTNSRFALSGAYHKRVRLPSINPKLISGAISWLTDNFADGGGTTGPRCPVAGGGLVGLQRYGAMRKNAPSP